MIRFGVIADSVLIFRYRDIVKDLKAADRATIQYALANEAAGVCGMLIESKQREAEVSSDESLRARR